MALPVHGGLGEGLSPLRQLRELRTAHSGIWLGEGWSVRSLGAWGLLVGCSFDRGGSVLADPLADAPGLADLSAVARWLVGKTWGAWFAVLIDPRTGAAAILRDPSGLLPLYRRIDSGRWLLATAPALFAQAGIATPVSWPRVQQFLQDPERRQRATCLAGVDELSPGVLHRLGQAVHEEVIWQPALHLSASGDITPSAAAQRVRDCARMVVRAWSGHFGRVVVAASGGVDSSLVCAALAVEQRPFSCATVSTRDPSGDETAYVASLAARLAVPWRAAHYALAAIDSGEASFARSARPVGKMFVGELRRQLSAACAAVGAARVLDGNGGDNVFCFLHSAAPFLDAWRALGSSRQLAQIFVDLCRLTGADAPTLVRAIVRQWWRRQRSATRAPNLALLAGPGETAPSLPLTDWEAQVPMTATGARAHLRLIQAAQHHVHGLDDPLRFSPLFSQPLVETCLAIPSWVWCQGGINRAPARAAFAAELPAAITGRVAKAGPDTVMRAVFARDRVRLRAMLHDGLLAGQGLLDLAAIDAALALDAQADDDRIYRLLDLVEAEAWARSWS
ncbi:asparagine synthase (glutamine-hydrolysing) [Novosphingobium sp. SG916]|nr:asparagine synthase (glutamine-hydrolysing) [Novosphingobium sp. SG916]